MTVYARYDGNNARDYITPGKLYEVEYDDGVIFRANLDQGGIHSMLWEECPHLRDDNWTRIEVDDMTKQAHPSAQILREIADEAAVNPEPHLAFEQRCPTSSHISDREWHAPTHLRDLVDSTCRDVWQVRRKPKIVRVEGEVAQEVIDSAERIVDCQEPGDDVTVAHALLSLVGDE